MNSRRHVCTVFHHNNRSDRDRLSGVLRYAAERTDWDVRMIDRASPDFPGDCARTTHDWPIDGLILTALGDYRRDVPLFADPDLFKAKIDAVESDPNDDSDVCVRIDADAFAETAATLLSQRGYGTFGFYGTCREPDCGYAKMAERHFARAARKRRIPCSVFHEPAVDSLSAALSATSDWVARLPKPCGILAYSDDLARNLLDACRLAKASVPEQVALVGVDDAVDICETVRPTLTSILPDFELGGYLAAKMLDQAMLRGRHGRCRVTHYGMAHLTERASTRDLRNAGRLVTAALEFIRTAPLSDVSADAVAQKVGVSRRLLEMHFKKIVGRGVHATIRERRLTALHERLLKTAEPIGDLVLATGFKTLNAAQVAYSRRFGHSMSATRTPHLRTPRENDRQKGMT